MMQSGVAVVLMTFLEIFVVYLGGLHFQSFAKRISNPTCNLSRRPSFAG